MWNSCALRGLQTWLNSSCQQLVSASIGSVYKLPTTCPGGGGPAACTHCPSSSGGGARKNTIQFNSLKGAHEVVSRQVDGYNKEIKRGLLIAMILFQKLVLSWRKQRELKLDRVSLRPPLHLAHTIFWHFNKCFTNPDVAAGDPLRNKAFQEPGSDKSKLMTEVCFVRWTLNHT